MTEAMGLTGLANSAAAWGDYDNDGWPDLYVEGQLWHNDAGRRFTRVPGLPLAGTGIWGDFDNDGFLDLFCWGPGGFKLFRNLAGKGFADVSDRLPKLPMSVCRGAAWGDFNADGRLDLYVGGYEQENTHAPQPSALLLADGRSGFSLAWQTPGRPYPARGIAVADYNEDGRPDVYVSNYRLAPNLLLRNEGRGFRDVAVDAGVAGEAKPEGTFGHTIGSAWGDFDNDGRLDLFVGNFSHPPAWQDRSKFYRNLGPAGQWRFEDLSARAALAWQESYASPALADFDNDGALDLFFSTVYPRDHAVLYRNLTHWRFVDVTSESGIAAALTYQAAWADFDNDGRLDLVTGGRLFRNAMPGRHWLKVRLAGDGKALPRTPIGAQVRLRLAGETLTRQVEGSTGEGNQNDLTLHFGLGVSPGPIRLEIRWPNGAAQEAPATPDQTLTIPYAPGPATRPARPS
ncbi:MAG: CRTAC1 family protein [Planctomycetota bacterium]|nr:CRTAC1 family protein [Planctomycetota bacterium]